MPAHGLPAVLEAGAMANMHAVPTAPAPTMPTFKLFSSEIADAAG
jgi:hypothetical protein